MTFSTQCAEWHSSPVGLYMTSYESAKRQRCIFHLYRTISLKFIEGGFFLFCCWVVYESKTKVSVILSVEQLSIHASGFWVAGRSFHHFDLDGDLSTAPGYIAIIWHSSST